MHIRRATPEDYAACKKIVNQKENRAGLGFVSRVVFEDFARNANPRYMLFIAENAAGKLLGYVRALRLLKKEQTTIHEICRDVSCKGEDIGGALLRHLEKESLRQQANRLFLKSPTPGLYERHGFTKTGHETPAPGNRLKRKLWHYTKNI